MTREEKIDNLYQQYIEAFKLGMSRLSKEEQDMNLTDNIQLSSFRSGLELMHDAMDMDFKSRTCENCRYFIDEKGTSMQFCNAKTNGGLIGWNTYGKDFGCNKWEAKNEDN